MKESVFQSEITRSFKVLIPQSFYYKIPDAPIMSKSHKCPRCGHVEGNAFNRVPVYRPFDCECIFDGRTVTMELKIHCDLKGFAFNKLKDHQKAALEKVKKNKHDAYILINFRCNNLSKEQIIELGMSRINTVFIITPLEWNIMVNTYKRKSIPIDTFLSNKHNFKILPRIKLCDTDNGSEYGWDVRQLFDWR